MKPKRLMDGEADGEVSVISSSTGVRCEKQP
jgi:hypothetical protein